MSITSLYLSREQQRESVREKEKGGKKRKKNL
jgi:hypothetical protein